MKKLLIASIVMLASLTACQNENSNNEMNFSDGKASTSKSIASKEGDQSTTLELLGTANDEFLLRSAENNISVNGLAITDRRAYIACHTDYTSYSGHSCVYSGGYLFTVSWSPYFEGQTTTQFDPDTGQPFLHYTATQVTTCNCR